MIYFLEKNALSNSFGRNGIIQIFSDISGIQIQYLWLCHSRSITLCDRDFFPTDSSFISILPVKYESSRPLEHIHHVANGEITLIHQKVLGKSAPLWQLQITFDVCATAFCQTEPGLLLWWKPSKHLVINRPLFYSVTDKWGDDNNIYHCWHCLVYLLSREWIPLFPAVWCYYKGSVLELWGQDRVSLPSSGELKWCSS